MNLIERYGYERAKRELGYMDERSIAMISDSIEYREELRKELLEYRRANNIFEVGDKVVLLDRRRTKEWLWVSNTEDSETHCELVGNFQRYCLPHNKFRHATDEEITVGHRL